MFRRIWPIFLLAVVGALLWFALGTEWQEPSQPPCENDRGSGKPVPGLAAPGILPEGGAGAPAAGQEEPPPEGGGEDREPREEPVIYPARDKAHEGDVIGYFRVEVYDTRRQSIRGSSIDVYALNPSRGRTNFIYSSSASRKGRRKGLATIRYDKAFDREGGAVCVSVIHEDYAPAWHYFSWDEVWGKVTPVEIILEDGVCLELTIEGIDPDYFSTGEVRFDIAQFREERGRRGLDFIATGVAEGDLIEIRGIHPSRLLRIHVSDRGSQYQSKMMFVDPPIPERVSIQLEPEPEPKGVGVVIYPPNVLDALASGKAGLVHEFYSPRGRELGNSTSYQREFLSEDREWIGDRVPAGEYVLFLFGYWDEPDPYATYPGLDAFDAARIEVVSGERVEAKLALDKKGVRARLHLEDPEGKPVAKVQYRVSARVAGFDNPFPLVIMVTRDTPGGVLKLRRLPPGGRIEVWSAILMGGRIEIPDEPWRQVIEIPDDPGGFLEASVVVPPKGE